jgi:prokaryotic YEATS domain
MALDIQQGFTYQGNDFWNWWIWLEGPDEELDKVDHVVYILHPTFPDPVRTINDRTTKFRLGTSGWGVFTIRAKVVKKDGEQIALSHDLVLKYTCPRGKDGRFIKCPERKEPWWKKFWK